MLDAAGEIWQNNGSEQKTVSCTLCCGLRGNNTMANFPLSWTAGPDTVEEVALDIAAP